MLQLCPSIFALFHQMLLMLAFIGDISLLTDAKHFQLLIHFKPDKNITLASQKVTKSGKTYSVHLQNSWLEDFSGFAVIHLRKDGSVNAAPPMCIGTRARLVWLFTQFSKPKGKDGVPTNHPTDRYHQKACERAKAFTTTFQNPPVKDRCSYFSWEADAIRWKLARYQ